MSFNAISENKILAKISESTVLKRLKDDWTRDNKFNVSYDTANVTFVCQACAGPEGEGDRPPPEQSQKWGILAILVRLGKSKSFQASI